MRFTNKGKNSSDTGTLTRVVRSFYKEKYCNQKIEL